MRRRDDKAPPTGRKLPGSHADEILLRLGRSRDEIDRPRQRSAI